MSENEKKVNEQEMENEKLDLDELGKISGGAGLSDVYVTPTKDIDKSIQDRV